MKATSNRTNSTLQYAVDWDEGPLLVLGSSGTHRSSVIGARVTRLLKESHRHLWNILALTSTTRTAKHIYEAVSTQIPQTEFRLNSITYRTFAYELLSLHGSHIGLKPNYTVLSEKLDRLELLQEAMRVISTPYSNLSGENLLPIIDRYLDIGCDRRVREKMAINLKFDFEYLERVYLEYRRRMIEQNSLDEPSLVTEAIGLIRNIRGIKNQMYCTYRYICVDEFQKSDSSQYQLLKEVVNKESENLFVVADDERMLNQWNGSEHNLALLTRDFDIRTVWLPKDDSCSEEVLDIANKLVCPNAKNDNDEKVRAISKQTIGYKQNINILRFSKFEDEIKWVADSISRKTTSELEQSIVFASTKVEMEKLLEAFRNHSIMGFVNSRKTDFASSQLRWLYSILKLAIDRSNPQHLSIVCEAYFELTGIEIIPNNVITFANTSEGDFLRGWIKMMLNSKISTVEREFLESSVLHMLSDRLNYEDFQIRAFEWFDGLSQCNSGESRWFKEYVEERGIWQRLTREVYRRLGTMQISLHKMIEELELSARYVQQPKGTIRCSMIQESIESEVNHVYIVGMVDNINPRLESVRNANFSLDKTVERRNYFKAITKARETLHLTFSDMFNNELMPPSRFLKEMDVLKYAFRPSEITQFKPVSMVPGRRKPQDYRIAS